MKYLDEKYGHKKVLEETGLSRVTLWRLLEKKSRVKPGYVKPLLKLLTQEEFEKLVSARDRLRSMGILREDGTVDYSLALEILAVAKDDEYLKNAILKFLVQEFREDLKKMLGISFAGVKLVWSSDFESFLAERKKRRAIKDPETLKYYRSIFKKYLEGKELNKEFIDLNEKRAMLTEEDYNALLRDIYKNPEKYYVFVMVPFRRVSPEDLLGYPILVHIKDGDKTLMVVEESAMKAPLAILTVSGVHGVLLIDDALNINDNVRKSFLLAVFNERVVGGFGGAKLSVPLHAGKVRGQLVKGSLYIPQQIRELLL